MKEIISLISIKEIGENEYVQMRRDLCTFVEENFELLYAGACRLNCNIEADYYAQRRIQIGRTRLNEHQGVKIAGGHHYRDDHEPEADNIRETVEDIQRLINAASKTIVAEFELIIKDRTEELKTM